MIFSTIVTMALFPEQCLLRGPRANKKPLMRAFDGPAGLLVTWKRHREQPECGPGRRCWAYWFVELHLKQLPAGEAGELGAIIDAGCDESERTFLERRLAEIIHVQRRDIYIVQWHDQTERSPTRL
jgi:hypothetical protein